VPPLDVTRPMSRRGTFQEGRMSHIPEELHYTEDHEWIAYDKDSGVATVGITDYAQGELGDIVFLELPDVGLATKKKISCGTIEAVKAVAELYAPLTGEIVEVNHDLDDHPEIVNQDPYGEGWMIKVRVADPDEVEQLLDSSEYQAHVG
jgi:glycine cleavage system H protein